MTIETVPMPAKNAPAITNAQYSRYVMFRLSDAKASRTGYRQQFKTKKGIQLMHFLEGIGSEVFELNCAMAPFLEGEQLNDGMRREFANESGDLYFYLYGAAKLSGVKLANPSKRIKTNTTPTQLILDINMHAADIVGVKKKLFYGMPLDTDALKASITGMLDLLNALTWKLLDRPPVQTLVENKAKLDERFGADKKFSTEAIAKKDAAKKAAPPKAKKTTATV